MRLLDIAPLKHLKYYSKPFLPLFAKSWWALKKQFWTICMPYGIPNGMIF